LGKLIKKLYFLLVDNRSFWH